MQDSERSMKGFVPIFCASSQGCSFTSQAWHKNKMFFIEYDALQNPFLLVHEKPLLMKLINSCFSALPVCVCVCAHFLSYACTASYVRNRLGWGLGWLLAQGGAFGLCWALLGTEITPGTIIIIIISRLDFLGWLLWNLLRDIQEDNACLSYSCRLVFFLYRIPIKCLSHCQAALFIWYAKCFEERIPQLWIFPKHDDGVMRERGFLSSDITQYKKETPVFARSVFWYKVLEVLVWESLFCSYTNITALQCLENNYR